MITVFIITINNITCQVFYMFFYISELLSFEGQGSSKEINNSAEPTSKEELLTDSIKADTGSPVTSITSKIFRIFN